MCMSCGPFLFELGIGDKHFVFSCKLYQTIASVITTYERVKVEANIEKVKLCFSFCYTCM